MNACDERPHGRELILTPHELEIGRNRHGLISSSRTGDSSVERAKCGVSDDARWGREGQARSGFGFLASDERRRNEPRQVDSRDRRARCDSRDGVGRGRNRGGCDAEQLQAQGWNCSCLPTSPTRSSAATPPTGCLPCRLTRTVGRRIASCSSASTGTSVRPCTCSERIAITASRARKTGGASTSSIL